MKVETENLHIAMISIHSSPLGELGTRDTGGMSVYIRELSRELGSRGHRVDIFTRSNGGGNERIVALADNVRLVHLGINGNGSISKEHLYPHLPAYFSAMDDFATGRSRFYDLIHSHYWLSGELGHRARQRWNLPHVFMFHTIGIAKNEACSEEAEPPLRIAAEQRLGRSCQRLLTAAERDRQLLRRYYGVADKKIGVVPCGVNLDLFQPWDKTEARRRIGVDSHVPTVLYVGRFAPVKGLGRLLRAIARLQGHRRLQLVLVGGDGPDAPATRGLRKLAGSLGIADRVMFPGPVAQADLPPYYSAADALVVSSYYESFGLVALESLACNTPVVTTRVGAMESIIENGKNGQLIASPTVDSLAEGMESAIRRWWKKPPPDNQIRESVLRFSWSNVAEAIAQQYVAVLGSHRSPRN
jgi:D-inositol-3-phosphate glycosyltransferase